MAQRRAFTRAVERTLIEALQGGATYGAAAKAVGVSRRSVHRWVEQGQAGDRRYSALADAAAQGKRGGLHVLRAPAAGPKRTGRPTKCTPERTEQLCRAIRLGLYLEESCQIAGIGYSTHREWIIRAGTGREPYVSYAEQVKRAEAEAEARIIGGIQKAASEGAWQAYAWLAERRFPARWGRSRLSPTAAEPSSMSDQELSAAILDAAEQIKRSNG